MSHSPVSRESSVEKKSFRLNDPTRDAYLQTRFYENGCTHTTGVYVNNKKSGVFTTLYENGETKWLDNFVNGKQHGIVKAWYQNGVLELEEHYVHAWMFTNHYYL